MVIKLEFYNPKKNNQLWWDRLMDRVNGVKNRTWTIKGGCGLHAKDCEFTVLNSDGSVIADQKTVSEITWCFFIEQLNVNRFYVDGKDVTSILSNR
jgi:hypothetical protein